MNRDYVAAVWENVALIDDEITLLEIGWAGANHRSNVVRDETAPKSVDWFKQQTQPRLRWETRWFQWSERRGEESRLARDLLAQVEGPGRDCGLPSHLQRPCSCYGVGMMVRYPERDPADAHLLALAEYTRKAMISGSTRDGHRGNHSHQQ